MFVHGCFWHRHPGCAKASSPKSRREFWNAKFDTNVARDARASADLQALGWKVITVWECETRSEDRVASILAEVLRSTEENRKHSIANRGQAVRFVDKERSSDG
jgi:DNA mismatch endonuclease (patch repair protein)